ncbi:hypothetical protein ACFYUV_34445 [Nonomuraea sp. NPDC003560]|uniref:hypothetical protein n=1 Tax=Nonomuraea sp. NPDC003560 TaxID=3364341 RepID=UPI003699CF70
MQERPARRLVHGVALGLQRRQAQYGGRVRPHAPHRRRHAAHLAAPPHRRGRGPAAARAATGRRYVVADRQGEWTATWYLGQKAWFHNPEYGPVAVPSRARTATPRPGLDAVPVYGRACPEEAAHPPDVEVQPLVPLQYTFPAGQAYTVGLTATGEYYRATTFDTTSGARTSW